MKIQERIPVPVQFRMQGITTSEDTGYTGEEKKSEDTKVILLRKQEICRHHCPLVVSVNNSLFNFFS